MRRFAWVCLALVAASACDEAPSDPTDAGADAEVMDPSVIYVRYEPEGAGFYRTPWPSDARLTAEGTPDMTGFGRSRTLRQATAEIEARVRGFATMPVVYFALDAPVTEAAIPQNLDALSPESAIQLIDLSEEGCGRACRSRSPSPPRATSCATRTCCRSPTPSARCSHRGGPTAP
ncbi:MAG: hypothetical protein M5U28_22125 [Sandaracinaceae bacterium]|nr:hypothetical protein [Sandaracinaceae bacterium]